MIKISVLSDRFRDNGMVSHSHALWSAKLLKYANSLPDSAVKQNLLTIGAFVALNKKMCYKDFVSHFKSILDDATVSGLLTAFKDRPGVIKNLESTMRQDHPSIKEEEWKW